MVRTLCLLIGLALLGCPSYVRGATEPSTEPVPAAEADEKEATVPPRPAARPDRPRLALLIQYDAPFAYLNPIAEWHEDTWLTQGWMNNVLEAYIASKQLRLWTRSQPEGRRIRVEPAFVNCHDGMWSAVVRAMPVPGKPGHGPSPVDGAIVGHLPPHTQIHLFRPRSPNEAERSAIFRQTLQRARSLALEAESSVRARTSPWPNDAPPKLLGWLVKSRYLAVRTANLGDGTRIEFGSLSGFVKVDPKTRSVAGERVEDATIGVYRQWLRVRRPGQTWVTVEDKETFTDLDFKGVDFRLPIAVVRHDRPGSSVNLWLATSVTGWEWTGGSLDELRPVRGGWKAPLQDIGWGCGG
jgi:hypothetical protein